MMQEGDWVVEAEIQFQKKRVNYVLGLKDWELAEYDAREYAKQCLDKLIEMGVISHYHILSRPREVEL